MPIPYKVIFGDFLYVPPKCFYSVSYHIDFYRGAFAAIQLCRVIPE